MRKVLLFAGLLALSLTLLTGCGKNNSTTTTAKATQVNIGTCDLVNGDLIAQYEKWYEKELGVPVKLIKFDSGKSLNSAIASGGIDIGQEGSVPAALAIASGIDVEVFWLGDIIGEAETLAAKKDSGITSLHDLVGKKVGTPFATTAHYSLLNALRHEGIDASTVKILDLDTDDIFAAWQRGDIDAAYVWHPVLGEILKDGVAIINSAQLADKGIVTGDTNIVRIPFAKANPEIVTKFVELQLRANNIIHTEPERAAREAAAVLEIKEEDAALQLSQFRYLTADEEIDYLDNSFPEILKSTADFLAEQKSIKSSPVLEVFRSKITSEYVRAAKAQGAK